MIKLFSKKRKDLVSEKPSFRRTSNYIKYAIGEIVLVVIGILIALQINTWNQERINKNLEKKYYTRLLADLKEEKATIESFMDYNGQVNQHAKKAILLFENQHDINKSPNQDLINFYQASQIIDALAIKSTYQELISTGQLNIFNDDSLKTSIISYYNLNWSESLVFKFPDKYRDNLRSKMPNSIQEKIRTNCGDTYENVGRSTIVNLPEDCEIDIPIEISKQALESLISDTKLKEDLLYLIGNLDGKLQYLNIVKIQLENLINQIESIKK